MVLHSASLWIPEVAFTGKLYFAGIQRLHILNVTITFITLEKLKSSCVWFWFFVLLMTGRQSVCNVLPAAVHYLGHLPANLCV